MNQHAGHAFFFSPLAGGWGGGGVARVLSVLPLAIYGCWVLPPPRSIKKELVLNNDFSTVLLCSEVNVLALFTRDIS